MSRSEFPDKVDNFVELFDLPANLYADANEYTKLKAMPVLDNNQQNRVKALAAELHDYIITPETMNKVTDCMVALETFFNNNVRGYIANKQKEWDTYINNFNHQGIWDSTKKYGKQNLVSYNGDLYLVIKNVVADKNHVPSNTPDCYRKIAYKGDKGDIGLNAYYKGVWNGSIQYGIGDAVSIKLGDSWNPVDMVFISKTVNTGKKPDVSTDDWFPYNPLMVGVTKPANLHPSTHFIQVLD